MKSTISKINNLTLFNVTSDSVLQALINNNSSELSNILVTTAEHKGYSGNIFKCYIISLFLYHRNIYSLYCENKIDVSTSTLRDIALKDIEIMYELSNMDLSVYFHDNSVFEILNNYTPSLPKENKTILDIAGLSTPSEILDYLTNSFHTYGCGKLALYRSFRFNLNTGLVGIEKPDKITFDDIIGYEAQTSQLINNTEAFLSGFPANNVLLVGARGTGKSSSVKALVNKYFDKGLRLIEITKEQIIDLPAILSTLENRGCHFIVFLDDLSFDEQEIQYKYMKSLLDGGSVSKPDNVLFYATSNRRHLIQEKWGDRQSGSDEAEIHTQDTLNEKLSLADRFGITITFPKPTPQQYITIVKGLAQRNNLSIDAELLEKEAMKWEINQKGISGRTAKQFINNFIWQNH